MEKKKVTKKLIEFLLIEKALNDVCMAPGMRIQVITAKNLKVLKSELDPVRAKGKPSKAYDQVLKDFRKLQMSFVTHENDKPVLNKDGKTYQIADEEGLKAAASSFWEEHKSLQEEDIKRQEEYSEWIQSEELTLELILIPLECLPEKYFQENPEKIRLFVKQCEDLII